MEITILSDNPENDWDAMVGAFLQEKAREVPEKLSYKELGQITTTLGQIRNIIFIILAELKKGNMKPALEDVTLETLNSSGIENEKLQEEIAILMYAFLQRVLLTMNKKTAELQVTLLAAQFEHARLRGELEKLRAAPGVRKRRRRS